MEEKTLTMLISFLVGAFVFKNWFRIRPYVPFLSGDEHVEHK